jgi:hypothetical protein
LLQKNPAALLGRALRIVKARRQASGLRRDLAHDIWRVDKPDA